MELNIKFPLGFVETDKLCACGEKLWQLPSGEMQATCPKCQMKDVDDRNIKIAQDREYLLHLTEQYVGKTWESCDPSSRDAFDRVRRWVTDYKPGLHLLLVGAQGTGKTCAARLAAWELWKGGAVTYFVTMNDLYQAYLNRREDGPMGADAREMIYYADCSTVLVIDECGYLQATDAAKQFYRSLHVRMHDSGTKTIILVSNFGKDKISEFFDRSRLEDRSWITVVFNGASMRGQP